LAETDAVRAWTSKKDSNTREEEVRKAASEGLLEFVKDEGAKAGREMGGSLVIAEIMLYAEGGEFSSSFHLDYLIRRADFHSISCHR
jgi:pumilio family protein 6